MIIQNIVNHNIGNSPFLNQFGREIPKLNISIVNNTITGQDTGPDIYLYLLGPEYMTGLPVNIPYGQYITFTGSNITGLKIEGAGANVSYICSYPEVIELKPTTVNGQISGNMNVTNKQLSVDISANSVGNLTVDLAANSIGNLTVDLAANSLGNLPVTIPLQPAIATAQSFNSTTPAILLTVPANTVYRILSVYISGENTSTSLAAQVAIRVIRNFLGNAPTGGVTAESIAYINLNITAATGLQFSGWSTKAADNSTAEMPNYFNQTIWNDNPTLYPGDQLEYIASNVQLVDIYIMYEQYPLP